MITTPEIICDLFSFLDKDQIERIQLVNKSWNNVIIRHKNILPLRQFAKLAFICNQIILTVTQEDFLFYIMEFDGTNLSIIVENVSSRYSQLTVDEVLTNLNDVVFDHIQLQIQIVIPTSNSDLQFQMDNLLNLIKLVTTKTGGRLRGRFGRCNMGFGSQLNEILNNYIIIDELNIDFDFDDSYIREVCANPEIVQLHSTPKEIRLRPLKFKDNDEVLNFTCNGKLNEANRLTIVFSTSYTNIGNFIRQWFELYRTHQNPISLVGKFETNGVDDAGKTFLNNTQLRVKYSLESKEFHSSFYGVINQYLKRSCMLHETDSYALVIEMEYRDVTDMSSINASDLDQPPWYKMIRISFCVKSL